MTVTRCPNPRCHGGWVERGDNESGGAPAFPCRHEACPHREPPASDPRPDPRTHPELLDGMTSDGTPVARGRKPRLGLEDAQPMRGAGS